MLERLFDTIGSLGGPAAYLAVAALAAAESSIGVGLVVPGETGMLVGGVIVSQGNASFGLMWLVAVVGAIVGDSIGYEVGRRFGPRIRRTRLGAAVGEERWRRAEDYLRVRGGRAIFLGRFVAVVRSLVPAAAGISRMPYPKFLLWNAFGALLWASMYVTLGYAAGRSYQRIADAAEGAGYVLLALLVAAIAILLVARWLARNPERVRGWGDAVAAWRIMVFLRRWFAGPIRFVRGRFRVNDAFGLSLTAGLVALIASGWGLAVVTTGVAERSDFIDVDRTVARWLADHRVGWLTDTMRSVTDFGSLAVLIPLLALVAVIWVIRARRWGVAVFLAVVMFGAVVATDVLKDLVERARPPVRLAVDDAEGFSFPSGHATQATAAYGAIAYLLGSAIRVWSARVAVWAVAVSASLLIGFTRAYLGVHWATDVVAGYALAIAWLTLVITAFGTGSRLQRRHAAPAALDQTASVSSRTA